MAADDITGIPRLVLDEEAKCVADILREFSQYQVWRTMHAQQWQEASELILPTSRDTFFYQNWNFPGQKKTERQIDATGALALHRFCAIADSMVTPKSTFWHALEGDKYLMKDRATRLWYEAAADLLFEQRYADHAGFSGQNYNNWQSLGAFGNSTMFIDEFDGTNYHNIRGLRYKAVPLGETFYGQNHQGKVDRIIRWFRLTAYQAVQKWGIERLPGNLHAALKINSQFPYNFLHCVKPRNEGYDEDRIDAKGKPFCSYYVSIEGQCLMQPEGGYRTFPYAVSRYDQTPGEVYGRGPAQIVLPGLKTLNAQKTTHLKAGHRAADPVLLLADDGLVNFSLRPGAKNYGGMNSDGKPLVGVLPPGDVKISIEMMQEERGIIDDVFLVSLFKVLTEHPNMTATQVIEMVNEKGMLVAPTLGRQFSEYVGGMVDRELDILSEMRMLPPMPPLLKEARGAYRVKDTSPLAKAAKMGEAAGFNRWVENLTKTATEMQDPSWLDVVNIDTASRDLADIYSVRTSWTATEDQIAGKRKARAEAQQRQERIQALPAEAAMAKAQAAVAKGPPQVSQGMPA